MAAKILRRKQRSRHLHVMATSDTKYQNTLRTPVSPQKKFPAGPGEATENHFTFASAAGYPPDPD